MNRDLSQMTLEKLWRLFPIVLKEHQDCYAQWYMEEKNNLLNNLDRQIIKRINHIGSTAVKGLIAKPTIDILLEIDKACDIMQLKALLDLNGWILMSEESEPELKLVYNKGYTPDGFAEKVFHLHIRYLGDWDELYFRDYLIEHDAIAKAYGRLKVNLLEQYEHDRDGYTKAKSAFILNYTQKARQSFEGRYAPDTVINKTG